jgi:hypothetical protein
MIQEVFPRMHVGKDVILGILPFFHIAGRSLGFLYFQREAENTNYRRYIIASLCGYGRVAGRDHATV